MDFRNYITEGKIDYLDVLANSIGASKKTDQDMWDWFEKNLDDSGIYPGDAIPEDYLEIMTDKQAKALYQYLSKKYKDVLDMNESLSEGKEDLSTYKDRMIKLIDENNNIDIRDTMAKLVGDKKILELVRSINTIVELEKSNPISEYTQKIYTKLNEMGRKKYGKDNWNSNIYNP